MALVLSLLSAALVARADVGRQGGLLALVARQQDCTSTCASLEPGLSCTNGTCLCPVLTAAGAQAIQSCASCLSSIPTFGQYATWLPILGDVCSSCETPCADLLDTTIAQIDSCNGTVQDCACGILKGIPSSGLASCNSCIASSDPSASSQIVGFEQQCGVSVSSAAASGSASATASATSATTTTGALSTTSAGERVKVGVMGFGILASMVFLFLTC